MYKNIVLALIASLSFLLPEWSYAAGAVMQATSSFWGILCVITFILAYILVMAEEFIHLPKSKPVVFCAGLIWIMVALEAQTQHFTKELHQAILKNFEEYCELFLFLLVAMTYINAMQERRVFDRLRAWLVSRQYNYRKLFWVTGAIAFFLSPIADNLTTSLVMCAVVMAVGTDAPKFVTLSCINIVVAANAGGSFSPFGDITTLMVWQKGILSFFQFFQIFVPAVVNAVIPAFIMQYAIENDTPSKIDDNAQMKPGAEAMVILFLLTITTAVCFHNFLGLPASLGMMTGFGYLQLFAYYLKITGARQAKNKRPEDGYHLYYHEDIEYDIFKKVANVEWDTLFFFYGVIVCVGGLGTLGYLYLISDVMYNQWGAGLSAAHSATPANITVGILSAIVDNIPVMFAVLSMHPVMSEGQWLLVTLAAGVGGSLLSIGSAAGVALMGQSKGQYTFFGHLRWTWAILIGYIASIAVHIWLNAATFHIPVPAIH